ncbi:MAG: pyridoxamine 5'-phosphate oxidase family protein [Treponema sp.]|jgi:nitroimidazol reductase NimA-like FMN-containing flavoprotein (pyridoxamine 5'-phosphate oxidase superfamily)|nr:pyridoxamine 5'-phosphate oxidase family protein [Treponema sp.]
MRRKDREITDTHEKLGIVGRCKVCRLAMIGDGDAAEGGKNPEPYLVPLNFGYEYREGDGKEGVLTLHFHSALEGRKIAILKNHPGPVCFEMDGAHRLLETPQGCSYSFSYESVIGKGAVEFIEDREEKIRSLNLLLRHQSGKDQDFAIDDGALSKTAVFRLRAETWSAKRH